MISNTAAVIFLLTLVVVAAFVGWSASRGTQLSLLHKLYMWLLMDYALWAVTMLLMWLIPAQRVDMLRIADSFTYLGLGIPGIYLLITIVISQRRDHLPRWSPALLSFPILFFVVALTNEHHHLLYHTFAIVHSEIVFGPFILVTGAYSYLCLLSSAALMFNFARRNPTRRYVTQSALLILGGMCPFLISAAATFSSLDLPITTTPLSFLPVLVLNGIAIYRFNLLNIKPVATQHILDWISDCYLVVNEKGLVISFNRPFEEVFALRYGIEENHYLRACIKADDVANKTAIYNLMAAIDTCRQSQSTVSYEQSVSLTRNGAVQKSYYVTDVSPLIISGQPAAYVIIFKDVTQMKRNMQRLRDSEKRMMEQERLAFLGQMVGGLAHNLKTPIMSISGCISAADGLIDECLDSLEDPVVTPEDYREIYGEIRGWFQKIQESSAYMSDIITAIKGQATNVSVYEESEFTLDELLKRTTLLMRHELQASGCTLVSQCRTAETVSLRGDINNLVQVLVNLVSNAIYAQKQSGGGTILLGMEQRGGQLDLYVKDTGPGIPENVQQRLFKEMITSKGAQGSGLGLYISNAVVRGKFSGQMWARNAPEGGAVIGMTIPLNTVHPTAGNEEATLS